MPRTHEQQRERTTDADSLRKIVKKLPAEAQRRVAYFRRTDERETTEHYARFNADQDARQAINRQAAAVARYQLDADRHARSLSPAEYREWSERSGLADAEERLAEMKADRAQHEKDAGKNPPSREGGNYSEIVSYLVSTRSGKFTTAEIDIHDSDDDVAALAALREEIAKIGKRITDIDAAPVTIEDSMAEVDKILARCGAGGTPDVYGVTHLENVNHNFGAALSLGTIKFPTEFIGGTSFAPSGIDFVIWAFRDEIRAKLQSLIESRMPKNREPIAIADRAPMKAELESKMLVLEREECAMVWRMKADGQRVAHRVGADVRALLGIEQV